MNKELNYIMNNLNANEVILSYISGTIFNVNERKKTNVILALTNDKIIQLDYKKKYYRLNYISYKDVISINKELNNKATNIQIKLIDTVINIKDVDNKSSIEFMEILNQIIEYLKTYDTLMIEVDGVTYNNKVIERNALPTNNIVNSINKKDKGKKSVIKKVVITLSVLAVICVSGIVAYNYIHTPSTTTQTQSTASTEKSDESKNTSTANENTQKDTENKDETIKAGDKKDEDKSDKLDLDGVDYKVTLDKETKDKDIVKLSYNVVIDNAKSKEDLINISTNIIKKVQHDKKFNGLSIYFSDKGASVSSLGYVEFAPNGEIDLANSVKTGDYDKMVLGDYLIEKDWTQRPTPDDYKIENDIEDIMKSNPKLSINDSISKLANQKDLNKFDVFSTYNKILTWYNKPSLDSKQ